MEINKDTKPGCYRTTKDHRHPKPDKRLRGGWLSADGVPAGTRIVVERRPDYALGEIDPAWVRLSFELPGPYTRETIDVRFSTHTGKVLWDSNIDEERHAARLALFKDIVADLEPVREGTAVLAWIDPGRGTHNWPPILAALIHAGRVSEADVRVAVEREEIGYARDHAIDAFERGWAAAEAGRGAHEPFPEEIRGNIGGGEETRDAARAGFLARNTLPNGPKAAVGRRLEAQRWAAEQYPMPEWPLATDDTTKWLAAERELATLRAKAADLEERIASAMACLGDRK